MCCCSWVPSQQALSLAAWLGLSCQLLQEHRRRFRRLASEYGAKRGSSNSAVPFHASCTDTQGEGSVISLPPCHQRSQASAAHSAAATAAAPCLTPAAPPPPARRYLPPAGIDDLVLFVPDARKTPALRAGTVDPNSPYKFALPPSFRCVDRQGVCACVCVHKPPAKTAVACVVRLLPCRQALCLPLPNHTSMPAAQYDDVTCCLLTC